MTTSPHFRTLIGQLFLGEISEETFVIEANKLGATMDQIQGVLGELRSRDGVKEDGK